MENLFDTIIIGGGPAGLSATVYSARKILKTLVIAKSIGGETALAGSVENYLGFTLISGAELANKFREDVERFKSDDLQIKEAAAVSLTGSLGKFKVETEGREVYFGKTVIIASGRIPKLLGVPGEKEFLGRGVSACATCDAPFYRGKEVVVAGGGNSALDAVFSLIKLAKSVVLVNSSDNLTADGLLVERIKQSSVVTILNSHEVLEILGSNVVTGVKVKDRARGEEQVLKADGVFVEIGYDPSTSFDQLTEKNEQGLIVVDEAGVTSVPGIWAAGDVNSLWGEQMIIAAGEGAKAALAVARFLSEGIT